MSIHHLAGVRRNGVKPLAEQIAECVLSNLLEAQDGTHVEELATTLWQRHCGLLREGLGILIAKKRCEVEQAVEEGDSLAEERWLGDLGSLLQLGRSLDQLIDRASLTGRA